LENEDIIEIVPAILSKTSEDLGSKVSKVGFAPILQIDLMDGKFVGSKTVGLESLSNLPKDKIIEYHLMVENPMRWIEALPGGKNSIFQVHLESCDFDDREGIRDFVKSKGSELCWALNPGTDAGEVEDCVDYVNELLVMTVHPGKSGQSYISEMEKKISELRVDYPDLIIEVDGGINEKTIPRAVCAGSNRLAAASALFEHADILSVFDKLKQIANDARSK